MGDNAADRCPAMAGPHEQSYQEAARLDCSSIFCCKLASVSPPKILAPASSSVAECLSIRGLIHSSSSSSIPDAILMQFNISINPNLLNYLDAQIGMQNFEFRCLDGGSKPETLPAAINGGVSQPLKASHPDLQQGSNLSKLLKKPLFLRQFHMMEGNANLFATFRCRSVAAIDCKIGFLAGLFNFIWGFMDGNSSFSTSKCRDIKGLIELFEASHLALEGENILEEAKGFSNGILREAYSTLDGELAAKVAHILELPSHLRLQWFQVKWHLKMFKPHIKLNFNRDQVIESFTSGLGLVSDPKQSSYRKWFAKAIALVIVIDDIYDVYGSLEELQHLTNVVDRLV
ncbi:hypothetical protein LWI29_013955 [Acer saccharum]|uniref:Terpene synthase metal-binding domain-containing protein n=1 Tax=Acer saccharum TaxID=4024 RepID=A0AA39W146_ACESA|nr:hypothetical protein LWI29_013955 [Acer saccharum]